MPKNQSIYLAAPLFSLAEREFNERIAENLSQQGFLVILPQEEAKNFMDETGQTDFKALAINCAKLAISADVMIAILDGSDVDSGTAFEIGARCAFQKPTIGVRTDFRSSDDPQIRVNAMFRLITKHIYYDGGDLKELARVIGKEIAHTANHKGDHK